MATVIDEQHREDLNNSRTRIHHGSAKLESPVAYTTAATTQPLLALSGLGLAYGSLKSVMRKIKRSASSPFKLPTYVRRLPKYMKSNYVKYPLIFMVFVAAARRVRTSINH